MAHIRKVLPVFVSLVFISTATAAEGAFTSRPARDAQAKYEKAKSALQNAAIETVTELRKAHLADLTAARKKALMEDDLDEAQRILALAKKLEAEKDVSEILVPAEPFKSQDARQAGEKFQQARTVADREQSAGLAKLRAGYEGDLAEARKQALVANDLDEAQRIVAAIKDAQKDRRSRKLPGTIEDVALGGGGRYLILSLPRVGKLAVIDVVNPQMMKLLEIGAAGPVRLAAGSDQFFVLNPDKKSLSRYSLATLPPEGHMTVPFEGKITGLAMGSASYGPLYLIGEKPPLTGSHLFIDVQRMSKMDVTYMGQGAAHTGDGTTVLASADGRVFGVGGGNFFSHGFHTVVLEGTTATASRCGGKPLYACPDWDGRMIHTSNGLYTSALKDPDKGPHHRSGICLPAVQGDFYLKADGDAFALYLAGQDEALLKVSGTGWPGPLHKDQGLPYYKRLFLLPAADRIVTIPAGNDQVSFERLPFSTALEKATIDYLFVASLAPPSCKTGGSFIHDLGTRSSKGGVTCHILGGPRGMSVSDKGKIEWRVPQDFTPGVSQVRVQLRDASGREAIHAFQVRVE